MSNPLGRRVAVIALMTTLAGCQMANGILAVPTVIGASISTQILGSPPVDASMQQAANPEPEQKLVPPNAVDDATSTLDRLPEQFVDRTNLGISYAREGRHIEAIEILLTVTLERPNFCPAQVQLGQSFRATHQIAKAEQAYLNCLNANPNDAAALLSLGVLYEIYRGEFALALNNYERYQEVNLVPDQQVDLWIADLSRRLSALQTTNQIAEVQR